MSRENVAGGQKPRIAFISTMCGEAWGGSEELWGRTALRLLTENRAEVHAHVNWHPDLAPVLREFIAAGGQLTREAPLPLHHRILRRALRGRRTPYLERVQPDLTVVSQGAHFDGATWMYECADRNLRYASICQCFVEGHSFADTHAEPLRRGYDESAMNYFVSHANLHATRRLIAAPLKNAKVVFNPVNVPYDASPSYPEPKDGVYRLACVARLDTTVKGYDILFDVLRQPKWKERPLAVSLYGSGPNERTLFQLKEMFGLENVHFAGRTSDIPGVWASHHAAILFSRWEGLPLAIVEALLCGRIAIVTDIAGNAELLTDNETGFVAAAPKTALADEALERAWARRAEWGAMGAEAARRVRERVPQDPVGVFANELMGLLG